MIRLSDMVQRVPRLSIHLVIGISGAMELRPQSQALDEVVEGLRLALTRRRTGASARRYPSGFVGTELRSSYPTTGVLVGVGGGAATIPCGTYTTPVIYAFALWFSLTGIWTMTPVTTWTQ